MSRRIEARPHKLGTPDNHEPDRIEELQQRQEKHARMIQGKPARAFGEVLNERMKKLRGEEDEEPEDQPNEEEEHEALLALHPGQDVGLANKKKIIVKG